MISFFPQLCPNCHRFIQDRKENPAITISKKTKVIKYESHEVPKVGSTESHGDIPWWDVESPMRPPKLEVESIGRKDVDNHEWCYGLEFFGFDFGLFACF